MRRLVVSFPRRLTPKNGKSCGAGPFLSNSPAPLRVPALHVSGAGRGISRGLRCTGKVTMHRAVGSGSHQSNVDGDSRSGNDGAPARHSTR